MAAAISFPLLPFATIYPDSQTSTTAQVYRTADPPSLACYGGQVEDLFDSFHPLRLSPLAGAGALVGPATGCAISA